MARKRKASLGKPSAADMREVASGKGSARDRAEARGFGRKFTKHMPKRRKK